MTTKTTAAGHAAPKTMPRGECRKCGLTYALNGSVLDFHHGITASGFSTGRRCPGVDLLPYAETGA
ncbi:hypothetical protein ACLQ2N_16485 [Streptomyces sp. DT224]|uniref:hypothetical protein n=1 Tax=Streptomyces sp. DT224 TaxID=3393426 RepID=UPI003CF18D61